MLSFPTDETKPRELATLSRSVDVWAAQWLSQPGKAEVKYYGTAIREVTG